MDWKSEVIDNIKTHIQKQEISKIIKDQKVNQTFAHGFRNKPSIILHVSKLGSYSKPTNDQLHIGKRNFKIRNYFNTHQKIVKQVDPEKTNQYCSIKEEVQAKITHFSVKNDYEKVINSSRDSDFAQALSEQIALARRPCYSFLLEEDKSPKKYRSSNIFQDIQINGNRVKNNFHLETRGPTRGVSTSYWVNKYNRRYEQKDGEPNRMELKELKKLQRLEYDILTGWNS